MVAIEMNEIRTPTVDDAAVEAAVLMQLLALQPARLSFEELLREVAGDSDDFAERDAVGRAVRDLAAAGLLHRDGGLLAPSRAARRFDELLDR
jgi:hypothetical protein